MSQSNPMHHDNVHAFPSREQAQPVDPVDPVQPEQPEQPAISNTPLTTVNAMAGLVIGWHGTQMEHCLRMLEIPDGTEMQYEDTDKPGEITNIPLTGDTLKAFRVGVLTAMNLFETLPFVATEKPAAEATPEPAAGNADDANQG